MHDLLSGRRFSNSPKIASEHYTIRFYQVDRGLRLTLPSLCDIIQDAPARQVWKWGLAVPQLLKRNLTWMLSRLLIRMEDYPQWQEDFIAQTWPSGIERLFALRDYSFFNGKKEYLGSAVTAWLLIDITSRRPVRPDVLYARPERILEEHEIDWIPHSLPELAEESCRAELPIRSSDMDMNEHVNASRYFDWILEVVPQEIKAGCHLKELEVNFLSEAVCGELLISRAGRHPAESIEAGRSHLLHCLDRIQGQQVARARSLWIRRDEGAG